MPSIKTIVDELNLENGSKHKEKVLAKYADNDEFRRVLEATFDRVKYVYGISIRTIGETTHSDNPTKTLMDFLVFLTTDLAGRVLTGNAALATTRQYLSELSVGDHVIARRVIDRDLRINTGRTTINKVIPGLITKQLYMRCGTFSKKAAAKINFLLNPFVQLKADGTYREFAVLDGKVSSVSRSGEDYEYPILFEQMSVYPDGYYFGELTVWKDGSVLPRSEGNGLLNSDNPPHSDIKFQAWDYVDVQEYTAAVAKVKGTTTYEKRFEKLQEIIKEFNSANVELIPSIRVSNVADAMKQVSVWMDEGFEGGILKSSTAIFRDGTSDEQLKMKLVVEADVRLVGFQEGTPGKKRAATFGAAIFETDDGKIKGRVSGFTDAQLEEINADREAYIGKIMVVEFNDLSMARGNDYYALSHPRFIEFRTDKEETDTVGRVFELRQMAIDVVF